MLAELEEWQMTELLSPSLLDLGRFKEFRGLTGVAGLAARNIRL